MNVSELCDHPMAVPEAPGSLVTNIDQELESLRGASNSWWRFEEAEMPSISMTTVFSDGLYYCQNEMCREEKGFKQKGLFR